MTLVTGDLSIRVFARVHRYLHLTQSTENCSGICGDTSVTDTSLCVAATPRQGRCPEVRRTHPEFLEEGIEGLLEPLVRAVHRAQCL